MKIKYLSAVDKTQLDFFFYNIFTKKLQNWPGIFLLFWVLKNFFILPFLLGEMVSSRTSVMGSIRFQAQAHGYGIAPILCT